VLNCPGFGAGNAETLSQAGELAVTLGRFDDVTARYIAAPSN